MNLAEATKLVITAGALYPSTWEKRDGDTQRLMFAAWASMLEDIDLATAMSALKRHAATNKWFPSVAEIRAIASESAVGRKRPGIDAWADVKRAVGSTGRYLRPAFADPIVARVVESIGWESICDSEDEMVTRAHFAKAYDALATGAAEDATVETLPGVARPAQLDGRRAATLPDRANRLPIDEAMRRLGDGRP